jgi:hypothetical protein
VQPQQQLARPEFVRIKNVDFGLQAILDNRVTPRTVVERLGKLAIGFWEVFYKIELDKIKKQWG